MMGRGYDDDGMHGRRYHRSRGWHDEHSRDADPTAGRYRNPETLLSGSMRTFEQFLSYQDERDAMSPVALELYNVYKADFKTAHPPHFFNEHKDEEWFKEKYHPAFRLEREQARARDVRDAATNFFSELETENEGTCPPCCEPLSVDVDTAKQRAQRVVDRAAAKLFIRGICPSWKRADLLQVLDSVEGCEVQHLSIRDPQTAKGLTRHGWVTYADHDAAAKALEQLKNAKVNGNDLLLSFHRKKPRTIQMAPAYASTNERLQKDLEHLKDLIRLLDDRHGVEANPLIHNAYLQGLKLCQQVDRMVWYLRRVHWVCYYCSDMSDVLETRCLLHFRLPESHKDTLPAASEAMEEDGGGGKESEDKANSGREEDGGPSKEEDAMEAEAEGEAGGKEDADGKEHEAKEGEKEKEKEKEEKAVGAGGEQNIAPLITTCNPPRSIPQQSHRRTTPS